MVEFSSPQNEALNRKPNDQLKRILSDQLKEASTSFDCPKTQQIGSRKQTKEELVNKIFEKTNLVMPCLVRNRASSGSGDQSLNAKFKNN